MGEQLEKKKKTWISFTILEQTYAKVCCGDFVHCRKGSQLLYSEIHPLGGGCHFSLRSQIGSTPLFRIRSNQHIHQVCQCPGIQR